MATLIPLIRKDVLRKLKSPAGVLALLAVPVVLSLVFGLVFAPAAKQGLPRFKLLLVNGDDGLAGQFVKSAFTQGDLAKMVELHEVSAGEGRTLMEKGKATALLEIPPGLTSSVLEGRPARLRLVKNPAQQFLPDAAEKIAESVVQILDAGGKIFGKPLDEAVRGSKGESFPTEAEWVATSLRFRERVDNVRRYAFPPVVQLRAEEPGSKAPRPQMADFFALFLPGMTLMSLLFIAESAMRDLSAERSGGQLRRIFTSPVRARDILAAKLAYAVVLVMAAFLLITAVGVVFFGMRVRDPLPFLLSGILSSFSCAGVMALVYGVMGGKRGGEAVSAVVVVVMCMLGGSFVSVTSLPATVQVFSRLTVNYWSIHALQAGIAGQTGWGGYLRDWAALAAMASATIGGATWILRRQIAGGTGT